MSDTGLSQPDVCPIRIVARQAEFAEAARGVIGAGCCLPTDHDLPLPDRDRRIPYHRLRQVANADFAAVPHRLSNPIRHGTGGASLLADICGPGAGAGR